MIAKEQNPVNLSPREMRAVGQFLSRLQAVFGSQVRQAFLFGSKARGEATSSSDIDILLLVENETWAMKDEICNIAADINLENDLQIDTRVIGLERWQHMEQIQAGLYRMISQDAIPLAG